MVQPSGEMSRVSELVPDSRPSGGWLLSPADWCVADKCALILGIYLIFTSWALAAGWFFLTHPERAAYLAPAALAVEVRVLAVQALLATVAIAWAFAVRRREANAYRPLVYFTAILCAFVLIHGAYAYGTQTRLYTAAAICGSVAVAAVLFERRVVLVWVLAVMGGLTFLTIGEFTGLIGYAPLLARVPVTAEHLAPSWMLGPGGISLAILYVAVGLTFTVVSSWHERGERLVEAAKRLAVADTIAGVINAIDDGVVVLDSSGRVISANDAFLERTGSTRAALLGTRLKSWSPALDHTATHPVERRQVIIGRQRSDGKEIWEEVHSSPLAAGTGETTGLVEVWRDITARRHEEAKMAEAHRLASVGTLASGFSHEINTPLTAVMLCIDAILRLAKSNADGATEAWQHVQQRAEIAREQILRCNDITRHFLRLARDSSAGSEVIDVDAAVSAVVRLAAPTAEAAGVTLANESATAGALVDGNTADFEHILLNLVMNAIEASDAGETVRVTCDPGDPVRIRVSDTGPGVRSEDQARIFEPFYTSRPGGTGLGLFLARDFARRWGADIEVHSEPGSGATFEIVWPASAAAAAYC